MQNTENNFQLTDEFFYHARLSILPKTLYNVRRLLRNYYNYSVVHFPFSKISNNSVEKNPKHP